MKHTSIHVPVAGLGTLHLEKQALVSGLKRGFRCIDGAKAYPKNEDMIGEAICESGVDPNTITVITKVYNPNVVSRKALRDAVTDSVRKLRKTVDFALFHAPYPEMPLVSLIEELENLQKEGQIIHWGTSNFSQEHLEFMLNLESPHITNNFKPALNQVEYHPYFQRSDLRDFCQQHGIVLQAYRPLAEGKVLSDPVLVSLGAKYKVDVAQIVYAWLAQQGIAIVTKVSSDAHQQEYADAAKLSLTDEDMNLIGSLNRGEAGRTCTKGGWFVEFTPNVKNHWVSKSCL